MNILKAFIFAMVSALLVFWFMRGRPFENKMLVSLGTGVTNFTLGLTVYHF